MRTALVHQREAFQELFATYISEKPTPQIGLGESVGGLSITSFPNFDTLTLCSVHRAGGMITLLFRLLFPSLLLGSKTEKI